MVKENPNCGRPHFAKATSGRDSSGKPTARNERGLVTDSPQAAQNSKMDNMTYTYTGNQLTRVDDAVVKNAVEDGFKESTKVANEYLYDLNGGMNKDLNKDISAISYNILNLPRKVW